MTFSSLGLPGVIAAANTNLGGGILLAIGAIVVVIALGWGCAFLIYFTMRASRRAMGERKPRASARRTADSARVTRDRSRVRKGPGQ